MTDLTIKVNKEKIKVHEFMDYADVNKYFAVGQNGNLYYQNGKGNYDLLKKDFDLKIRELYKDLEAF